MADLWTKIDTELQRRHKPWAWLARAVGVSDQAINHWKNRGVPSRQHKPVADLLGWSVDQLLDSAWMPDQHTPAGVAQELSLLAADDEPSIPWGALVTTRQLPRRFWAVLPDDAMAPRAPRGTRILFAAGVDARPGDGVLVADQHGGAHFRLYRQGTAGRWSAAAINPAFDDLDSQRDGLRVLGVLLGMEGRWS